MAEELAAGQTPAVPSAKPPARSRGFVRELATITIGVLIALALEGVVEWSRDRALVREARANVTREIADNRDEMQVILGSLDTRRKNIANALTFADELLAAGKTRVNEMQVGSELADLSAASWETAAATGALGHMEYPEVKQYAELYALQALYTERQKAAMQPIAAAGAMFSAGMDPTRAPKEDLERFRQHVLAMRADLLIEEQFARRLVEAYDRVLKESR